MKLRWLLLAGLLTSAVAQAQEEEGPRGFQLNKLFTGGSISFGFSSNTFQLGGSPFFGYSLGSWIDAGIVINYNYTSFRHVYNYEDKLKRSTYGGGAFTRIYPIDFLFVHAQFERNRSSEKYIPANGSASDKMNFDANSLLVGAGYATGRYPESGQPFFYVSILFDLMNQEYSPYANSSGNIIPIIRGGVQVPLFQNKR